MCVCVAVDSGMEPEMYLIWGICGWGVGETKEIMESLIGRVTSTNGSSWGLSCVSARGSGAIE